MNSIKEADNDFNDENFFNDDDDNYSDDDDEVRSRELSQVLEPLSSLVEVTSRESLQLLEPLSCQQSCCTSCFGFDHFLPDYSTFSLQQDHDSSEESAVDMDDNECMRRALIELRSSIESETDDSIAAAMTLGEVNEVIDNINNEFVMEYAREIYNEAINTVGVQIFDAYSSMHSFLARCVAVGHADLDADLVAHQIQMEEAKGAIGFVVAC